ncbi:MFS transporter [Spartobacteria bacterium LR76]|nr:MFS transporter [Spartobacteria bacterium LR76]
MRVSDNSPPPSAPPVESSTGRAAANHDLRWRAGTLVYTSSGLFLLFAWLLLGDFSWSMRERSVSPMAQWYLSQLDISNLLFALLMGSIPALLGIIIAPIVSVMSDRHRGPRGRRIPFLLITTPFAAGAMIGLGLTPLLSRAVAGWYPQLDATTVALFGFCLSWTIFEIATIAGGAVFGGLLNDVVPPGLIGRFHGLFRAVSLIDGIIFNYWLMGHTPGYFTPILVGLGLFYGISFMFVCLKIREGGYPPVDTACQTSSARRGPLAGIASYLRTCFSKPYYVSVFLMMTLAALAFLPMNTFAIRYASHLHIGMDAYGKVVALTYLVSLLLAYPLGWLADLFHPLRVGAVTLGLYAGVMLWTAARAATGDAFLLALLLHGVCSGSYFTCSASLGNRLYPASHFARYASAAGIPISLSALFFPVAMGALIDWRGGAYHWVFPVAGGVALCALGLTLAVYRQFLSLGGIKYYSAP